jgi:hypothetical protein
MREAMMRRARSTDIPAFSWLQHWPHTGHLLREPCAGRRLDKENASSGRSVTGSTWSTWLAPG